MKKALISLALAASVAASGLIYPSTMIVYDVSGDLVTIKTATGDFYQFRGDGWIENQVVSVLMWSNGTTGAEDDAILAVRDSGFRLG